MIPRVVEWVCVAVCVGGFATFIYFGFNRWDFHKIVIGDRKVPIRLPLFSFFWTLVTAMLFFLWRELDGSSNSSIVSHHYFSFGWNENLVLFGLRINTWWSYAVILNYQITRSVLNSLLNNIYLPWLNKILLAPPTPDSRPLTEWERVLTLVGQALTTTATWWGGVTNILTSVSQFDLAVVTLVAGIACDAELSTKHLAIRSEKLRELAEPAGVKEKAAGQLAL